VPFTTLHETKERNGAKQSGGWMKGRGPTKEEQNRERMEDLLNSSMIKIMKCPECGAACWRNEVDIGIGLYTDYWRCSRCNWDELQNYPMTDTDWNDWLSEPQ
jgi:hypothetical protein